MNESDVIRIVRDTIRQELAPILMGKIVSSDSVYRATARRYDGETPLHNLRNILPYGLASRPFPDTECLTIPVDGDPMHLNIVGQFDTNRPPIDPGEVCIYGPSGQQIWLGNDGMIRSGAKAAASPAVLGDILQTLVKNILQAFLNAPQIGTCAVGPVMLDPSVRSQLQAELDTRVIDNKTNFLAQKHFVDRGATQ